MQKVCFVFLAAISLSWNDSHLIGQLYLDEEEQESEYEMEEGSDYEDDEDSEEYESEGVSDEESEEYEEEEDAGPSWQELEEQALQGLQCDHILSGGFHSNLT